jgi:hypothetical protein
MKPELSIEKIIELVTREVMRELGRGAPSTTGANAATDPAAGVRLDMSNYRTPIVTENAIRRLHERAGTVIVPAGTIITPRAKEIMREKNITIVFE